MTPSGRGLVAALVLLASGQAFDIPLERAVALTDLVADGEQVDSTCELILLQVKARLRSPSVNAEVRHVKPVTQLQGWLSAIAGEPVDVPSVVSMCEVWLERQHLEVSARFLAKLSPEQRNDVCSQTFHVVGMEADATRMPECDFEPLRPGERLVYFVRHAQAWHNALPGAEGSRLWDPLLTPLGEEQARHLPLNPLLAKPLSNDSSARAQLVVVSPMRRTLQTAILGFNASLPHTEVPWKLDPDIQEDSDARCDTLRRPGAVEFLQSLGREDLAQQYAALPAQCFSKAGRYAVDPWSVYQRFGHFTARLLRSGAQRIVAVAHSETLRIGLGSWVNGSLVEGPLLGLAEARSYALSAEGSYRPLADATCFGGP